MNQAIRKFLIIIGAAALGALPAASQAQTGKMRVAVDATYPPFSSIDEDGKMVGFDVDMARALCAEMGVECEMIHQDWDGIIPALLAKKYDAIISSMTDTEERRKQVSFTDKYYKDGALFIGKKGDFNQLTKRGLFTKQIGVQRGTVTDNYLISEYPHVELRKYDVLDNAHEDLKAGRLDLVFADRIVQGYWLERNTDFESVGEEFVDGEFFGDIAIAVRKEDDDLRARLNDAIKAVRENGVYKKINDKYFSFDIYGD